MKSTNVARICNISPMQAIVIHKDTLLETAVRHFARDPNVRGIFLVDDNENLVGVVNNHDLLPWIRLLVGMSPSEFALPLGKVRRLLSAKRIADLAHPGSQMAAVRMEATLADALNVMARFNLVNIPVVDKDGRIVNDLRLSEVLAYALQHGDLEL